MDLLELLEKSNLPLIPGLLEEKYRDEAAILMLITNDSNFIDSFASALRNAFLKIYKETLEGELGDYALSVLKLIRVFARNHAFGETFPVGIGIELLDFIKVVALNSSFICHEDTRVEAIKMFHNLYSQSKELKKQEFDPQFLGHIHEAILSQDMCARQFILLRTIFMISTNHPPSCVLFLNLGIIDSAIHLLRMLTNQLEEDALSFKNVVSKYEDLKFLVRLLFYFMNECSSNKMQLFKQSCKVCDLNDSIFRIVHTYRVALPLENISMISSVLSLFLLDEVCISEVIDTLLRSQTREKVTFMDYNLELIDKILQILDSLLSPEQHDSHDEDRLIIISGLTRICQVNRIVRKYCKSQILTPLQDANVLPETLNNLKGKLIRLMSSVSRNIMYSASILLYTLCKENASVLIMHCGLGNSAGFLSIIGFSHNFTDHRKTAEYSSDEDVSKNEYESIKDNIEVITKSLKNNL